MTLAVRRWLLFVVVTAASVVAVVPLAARADAAADGLSVRLTADQPIVTVDRDAPADQSLAYEIVVTNAGADVVPGITVEARLPGGTVTRPVGDVAPGAEWRAVVTTTIAAATTGGGPVDSVAIARAADGRSATSPAARVDVQVISSAVYDRDVAASPTTAPATQVLGAIYEQPRADPLPTTLARTGAPLAALAALGAALVLVGGLLARRRVLGG